MLIQFHTDNHIQSHLEIAPDVEEQLERAFARYANQVNRIEVYLHDMNADRAGDADKRCTIECRASGYEPVAVSHEAPTLTAAYNGARDKMLRTLDRRFGRIRHPKAHDRAEQGLNP